ncbi:hypothetical protein GZH49_36145 [Nocardia terpenica]|uniref:DUF6286 domain-containing protein n=1 Tax=Nocardia terpenica TaxID=455432 RepID=UPI002FE1CEE5
MRRRPQRAIPAVVLALTLVALCTAVILVLIQRLTGALQFVSSADIARHLRATTWDGPWPVGAGAAAVVTGVLLLALAVLPGRPTVVPLADHDAIAAGVTRRGLHRALREAAQSVDGVRSARIRLHRRHIRVVARIGRVHSADLAETVRAAVDERVTRIGPHPAPRVSARLRRTRSLR